MKSYFSDLFKYNDWANRKVLTSIASNGLEKHERVIELMSHILSAQFIWHLRIKGLPTSVFPVWERYNYNELVSMNEDSTRNWLKVVDMESDYQREIDYTNSKGQPFTNSVQHIMTHVANHGTHHRAQVSSMIRQEGFAPPATDFIFYIRELKVKP